MKKEEQINKLIAQAMGSVGDAQKATPNAYLLTRINARLSQQKATIWERMLSFIGRPAIAISGLCLLIVINVLVIINNQPATFANMNDQAQNPPDEFSNTIATIYDNENP